MAKLLIHGRDRAQTLVRARRALDEPEVEGRQHEPAGGILGATIKLASLPAAFAVYRAHDISPDLASALLDMNSAAFVSTLTPGPCCSAPPAPSCCEPGAAARVRLLRDRHRRSELASIPSFTSADPPTFMLTFVWIIAISVSLLRRGEHTEAVADRAEPATA